MILGYENIDRAFRSLPKRKESQILENYSPILRLKKKKKKKKNREVSQNIVSEPNTQKKLNNLH